VHVVDDHQGRPALGDARREPGQPVHRGMHGIAAADRLGLVGIECPAGQGGGADRQALPLRAPDRCEELPGDAPAGVLFQRTTGGPQRSHAGRLGGVRGGREQARLADAGRAVDDDHPTGAGAHGGDLPPQGGQLGVALQQHARHPMTVRLPEGRRQ
jgi:hypothetical protein